MSKKLKLLLLLTVVWIVLMVLLQTGKVWGATYFVKPTGNDDLDGLSLDNAWQHVQMACSTLVAGDTVFIRSGTYDEDSPDSTGIGGTWVNVGLKPKNGGTAGNEIVFKGYPGDTRPIVLGKSTAPSGGDYRSPALLSSSEPYIIYDSIEFRGGYRGIYMGTGHDITIRNCIIDSTLGPENNNNGGFITYNTSFGAVHHVIVENCEFFHNGQWIGSTPVYTPSGNTSGIHIYVCDNCDFRNNLVHDQEAGIHIKGEINDSTKHIKIYGNTVYNCNNGIWVVHTGKQEDIEVYDNIIYNSGQVSIVLHVGGGTDRRGENVRIYNNTMDCAGNCGLLSRYGNMDACSTFNNIIFNPDYNDAGYCAGHGFKNEGATPTNYYEDYNLYYGRSDSNYFIWPNTVGYTLQGWRAATDWGDNSEILNPLFVDAANHDYHLQSGSPAATGGKGGDYPVYQGAYAPSEDANKKLRAVYLRKGKL